MKIAILDTGLDRAHPDIDARWSSRVRGVRSWVNGEDGDIDRHGHGTHGAALLMRIAPEAYIYVARIARDSNTLNSGNIAKVCHDSCLVCLARCTDS